jgi:hypothetical protein
MATDAHLIAETLLIATTPIPFIIVIISTITPASW